MLYEAHILKAISETMSCEKCPYPCVARENSSAANCMIQWSKILESIDTKTDWKEARFFASTWLA